MKTSLRYLTLMLLIGIYVTSSFAQSGKALVLNGTDQFMRIANHEDFNITQSENFTVTAWVKAKRYVNNDAAAQRFIAKRCMSGTTGDNTSGYELWGAKNGNANNGFFANNAPGPNGTNHNYSLSSWSNKGGSLDTWFHVGLVVDRANNKMYLYHDGANVANSNDKDVSRWYVNNNFDVMIGAGLADPTNISYFFQGEIDNVRFYKKALSASEISADKTSTVDETTAGLVAAYDFENVSGSKVPDISGNGHDGLLVGFPIEGEATIASVSLTQDTNFTGRGNENETVLKATVNMDGSNPVNCSAIQLNMDGTTSIGNVTKIKIYTTGSENSFDPRNTASYTKLGECAPAAGNLTCTLTGNLAPGVNYLWITYDIADNAAEGNKVDANILSITTDNETYDLSTNSADGSREILLTRKLLFAPGDLGSKNYRIPAIVTAHDGSLVTATDKRKNNQGDLPEDIDILIRRSTDGGKTWSDALTIAQGTGNGAGYGDAALARTSEDGGLICIFVGGQGFFPSTPSKPIRTYICKSTDNGVTWTDPIDITNQLFGSGCTDNVRKNWYGSFCGSGAGLLTSSGRICFVAAVRENSYQNEAYIANYVYYSDDNGETWNVSGCVMPSSANEAKIVELNDGTLLVSIRNQSKGARYYSKSTDGGATWSQVGQWNDMIEPGCNGDIIYYTSTKDGYEKNRILHTVPNDRNSRANVSVFVSYDECETWPIKKSICPTGSAYSSLCILEDGTIGAYVEENYNNGDYSMYFMNFSLDWLTDGADTYHAPGEVQAVAAPTFSVAGGSYEETQTVALTTTTGGASIYYTLDESIPSQASTLYENSIEISETTIIKAIAIKAGMVDSPIATATYTFSPSGRYCYPTEAAAEQNLKDTYVERITTEGGIDNLDYSNSSRTFYTKLTDQVTIGTGQTFSLHLVAHSLGGSSTTIARQDLRYTSASLFIDWDQDGVFSSDEGEKLAGNTPPTHNVTGNMDVLDITKSITVPTGTLTGKVRARVVYHNAWGGTPKACGPVKEGVVYDFDINVLEVNYDITIVQPTEGGVIVVKNGETTIEDGASVGAGTRLTVEATPSNEYMLKHILVDGEPINGNQIIVSDNIQISAVFVKSVEFTYAFNSNYGTVNVTYNSNTVESGSKLELGTELSISVNPKSSCFVKNIFIDGADKKDELLPEGSKTFTLQINKTTDMNIVFDIEKYTVTYNAPQFGTLEVTDEDNNPIINASLVNVETILNIILTPVDDNAPTKLLINDGSGDEIDYVAEEGYLSKEEDGTYTTMVQVLGNTTINAEFSTPTSIDKNSLNSNIFLNKAGNIIVEGAKLGSIVNIYSVTGQKIAEAEIKSEKEVIYVPAQSIYLVRINDNSNSIVKKLIK